MKTARNVLCPCGSGKKYKKCCDLSKPAGASAQPAAASAPALLQKAIALHQAGSLYDAEVVYRTILEKDPDHPDALHLLGMVAHQTGNHAAAEELIRKAIGIDGTMSFFYLNLGNVLKAQGKKEEAVTAFRKALSLDPRLAEAHYNLANELCLQGDAAAAISHYHSALELRPGLAEAHYNLGNALIMIGKTREAEASYVQAAKTKPGYHEAHFKLGVLFQDENRYEQSMEQYVLALKIKPDYADAHYNLATVLKGLERYGEAETFFRHALKIRPDFAEAHNNLGVALRKQGRTQEAIESIAEALRLQPGFFEAFNNLGVTLREDGQIEEAITSCEHAIAQNPDFADAHLNLGLALLHAGRLARGWKEYEWRGINKGATQRSIPAPRWDGSLLRTETLFIYAEQGIGDQIMFASLLPEVQKRAERTVVECDVRLVDLFARSFPGITVIPWTKEPEPPNFPHLDYAIPIGSLPLHLRPDLRSYPRQKAYLVADAQKTGDWRQRIGTIGNGLKIGISWRGGKDASVSHLRSIPLDQWSPLFSLPGVQFVNLQYGDCKKELNEARQKLGVTVHDWEEADPLKDLDGFAAQIAALDLVISVDNSTVHMAGALGVPTWALLPRGSDWRWMRYAEDTPWYSTVRLFRQQNHKDWSSVFLTVSALLARAAQNAFSLDRITEATSFSYRDLDLSVALAGDCAGSPGPAGNGVNLSEQEKYRKAWAMDNRAYAKFSPGLKLSEQLKFLEFFKLNGVHSVLDAGIGSGKLCKKMMGMGFDCQGLDIADNCLDEDLRHLKERILTIGTLWDGTLFGEGQFDAVVCTDVLEHIQEEHVVEVLANFHKWTRKFLFLQVALYDDVFGARVGAPLHLTVKPKTWWDERLRNFKIISDFASKGPDNKELNAIYLLEKIPLSQECPTVAHSAG